MQVTIDRLLALRVSDVMTRPVVQVSEADSMAHAAAVMLKNKVSGTPVTDSTERCVGMLSAIDFMRRQHAETKQGTTVQDPNDVAAGAQQRSGTAAHDAPVQSIDPDCSLAKATQKMCRSHVHRLPVIGADGRIVGIISALDIVAAVMNAVEEMKS